MDPKIQRENEDGIHVSRDKDQLRDLVNAKSMFEFHKRLEISGHISGWLLFKKDCFPLS